MKDCDEVEESLAQFEAFLVQLRFTIITIFFIALLLSAINRFIFVRLL